MKEINYSAIISQVTGISEQDIEFMSEVQCISPNEAIEAIKLVLNMQDVINLHITAYYFYTLLGVCASKSK